MDQDKMSNRNRGLSIDASYQVSIHLVKRFQRRRFLEIDQSETRIACRPDPLTSMPPQAILVSDLLISKKSSPLKPLGQMNRNLAGNILGRSSIKFLHFVPFRQQIWPPRAILVSDWLMLKKSSPLKLL
jgi:hypothetical protein